MAALAKDYLGHARSHWLISDCHSDGQRHNAIARCQALEPARCHQWPTSNMAWDSHSQNTSCVWWQQWPSL